MRKALAFAGAVLVLSAAVGARTAWRVWSAAREAGGASLAAPRPALRPAEGGGPDAGESYRAALALLQDATDAEQAALRAAAARPWSDPDGSIGFLLQRRREPLELAQHGSELPSCDLLPPEASTAAAGGAPPWARLDYAALLLVADARRLASQGRGEEASRRVSAALRLAAHVRGQVSHRMRAAVLPLYVLEAAWPAAAAVAAEGGLSPASYAALAAAAERAGDGRAALHDAVLEERSLQIERQSRFLERAVSSSAAAAYRAAERELLAVWTKEALERQPGLYARDFVGAVRAWRLQGVPVLWAGLLCSAKHGGAELGKCLLGNQLGADLGWTDYGPLVWWTTLQDARMAVLRKAAYRRIEERGGGAGPPVPDPFAPGRAVRAAGPDGGWVAWSVGPDGEDQGGRLPLPELIDPNAAWKSPPAGDVSLAARDGGPVTPARRVR